MYVMEKLTEGSILKVLIKLALPIMASSFLATAYSITDMAWIGTIGSKAVAGVGVGGMYVWLSQGLSSLARMGGQVYAAQALGKGEKEEAKQYASAAVWMVLLFGTVFGAVSLLFTDALIGFFGLTDPKTLEYADGYMKITCGLIIFSYVGVVLTGLYTAQGDSKTPLTANFIGLVFNMILDPVLILGIGPFPKMEAVGAAIATVLAQLIVTGVLIVGILRAEPEKNYLRGIFRSKLPDRRYFQKVFRLGGPTALQGTLYCGISMFLTRMVAAFGDSAVAVQRVGGQIESLGWNTADGFAAAMNAFAAQNYGAGKMDRVKKGYRLAAAAIAAWGVLIGALFILFPEQIAGMFFYEAEAVLLFIGYLTIIGIGEPFMCVELMAVGAISGLGNTKICSMISICLTGMRIPLAILLANSELGLDGIWWALTISSICKGIAFHLTFHRECGKKQTY